MSLYVRVTSYYFFESLLNSLIEFLRFQRQFMIQIWQNGYLTLVESSSVIDGGSAVTQGALGAFSL